VYAIISKLDKQSAPIISELWQTLCRACGLSAIYNIPTPHFSWFVSEDISLDEMAAFMAQLVKKVAKFSTHTFGLGVFTGEKPVLYSPIVKSAEMFTLHEEIWEQAVPMSDCPNDYYSPKMWLPHVTLALDDLNQENLICAVNQLAFQPLAIDINVVNLVIAQYDGHPPGKMLHIFNFMD